MRRSIKLLTGVLLLGLALSCGKDNKQKDTAFSYKLYELQDRGWKSQSITQFAGDIHYRATEVPIEYYLLKNKGEEGHTTIETLSEAHNTERVIEFEFEHIQGDDLLKTQHNSLSYDDAVSYMASAIQRDYKVITSQGDTIPCSGVHFERHFKVSPFKRVLLYFSGVAPNDNIQLVYQDKLFDNGIFKFSFGEVPFKL